MLKQNTAHKVIQTIKATLHTMNTTQKVISDPEDEGSLFLHSMREHLPDYMASCPRRQYSSILFTLLFTFLPCSP
jgi:hypothetical protein